MFLHSCTSADPNPTPHADFDHVLCYETDDNDPAVIKIVLRAEESDLFEEADTGDGAERRGTTPTEKWEVHCSTVSQASFLAARRSLSGRAEMATPSHCRCFKNAPRTLK